MSQLSQLYEFSTGIHIEIRPSEPNGWISRGFTGQYINNTIDEIPYHVERAIANKLFSISEGSILDEPAIIGLVISGNNAHPDYSVIAIISQGKDNTGQPLSVTRWFLTEGEDKLPHIIWCLEKYKESAGKYPIFNPNETGILTQYWHICNPNLNFNISQDLQNWLNNCQNLPILIPPSYVTLENLHILTANKVNLNYYEIAWAYHAEALENTEHFVIIQGLNESLHKNKISEIETAQNKHIPTVGYSETDQNHIQLAIKNCCQNTQLPIHDVNTIARYMGVILDEDWYDLFAGIKEDIEYYISDEYMTRFFTFRAILIPETLFEFLEWINREDHQYLIPLSISFQQDFAQIFINNNPSKKQFLEEKLTKGIQNLRPKLLNLDHLLGLWKTHSTEPLILNYNQEPVVSLPEGNQTFLTQLLKFFTPGGSTYKVKIENKPNNQLIKISLIGIGAISLIGISAGLVYMIYNVFSGPKNPPPPPPPPPDKTKNIRLGLKNISNLVNTLYQENSQEITEIGGKSKIIDLLIPIICLQKQCLNKNDIISNINSQTLNETATLGEKTPNYQQNRNTLVKTVSEYQQQKIKSSNGIVDEKTINLLKKDLLGKIREQRRGKLLKTEIDLILKSGQWETTKDNLNKLVTEIRKNKSKSEFEIRTAIVKILAENSPGLRNYTGVITESKTLPKEKKAQQEYLWINGISSFQYNQVKPRPTGNYGIITSQKDPTYIKLKEVVLQRN